MISKVQFKVQFYNSEEGEFSKNNQSSYDEVIDCISKYTQKVYFKNSFTITKRGIGFYLDTNKHFLKIVHLSKDVFTLYFSDDISAKVYSGNFYLETMFEIVKLFFNEENNKIKAKIPNSNENKGNLIKSFIAKDFMYSIGKVTYAKHHLTITILLPLSIIILTFYNFDFEKLPYSLLIILITLIPLILFIRLNNNYKKISEDLKIKVSRGTDKILIWKDCQKIEFNKEEIEELMITEVGGMHNPFDPYEYSKIKLKNGQTFIIPNMIITTYELTSKLFKIKPIRRSVMYPIIR